MSNNKQINPRIRDVSREVLSDAWARLTRVQFDYLRADGQWQPQVREIYDRGHGAAVLLYNRENRSVILIRQFRFPVYQIDGDGFMLEVPAGVLEAENPEATIRAESEQETGFKLGNVTRLFTAYVSPGSVTEQIHYFVAPYTEHTRVAQGGGLCEEGEDIEVLEVKFSDAMDWIATGKITDAKTIVLLQHAALNLFAPEPPAV